MPKKRARAKCVFFARVGRRAQEKGKVKNKIIMVRGAKEAQITGAYLQASPKRRNLRPLILQRWNKTFPCLNRR